MKLYNLDVSGNCYKVRLFASFIDTPLTIVPVDSINGESKTDEFLQLNPLGEIPVLEDGDIVIRDSQAILVYLANKHGGEAWWPSEAHLQADVMQWLSTASNEIKQGVGIARLIKKFDSDSDWVHASELAHKTLTLIDDHLGKHNWLAASRPTIADCAVYPYISIAHEGDIDIDQYTNIQVWMTRLQQLPNYISMPGN